ncbi:MAG: peptide deformylase [Fibrobacteria bacterium]|nr:peptide deformylase [Fibrobacteria bacterium]
MAVLPILTYGDKILRKTAQPVEDITPELITLAKDMLDTMYEAPGIGLAAPQVGHSIRLIVVDVNRYEYDIEDDEIVEDNEKDPYILFNPEIIDSSGSCAEEEGCLSVPGINSNVVRPEVITIKALDQNGNEIVLKDIDDILARCIQHEMDHLEGILFVDKIGKTDKLLLSGKLKKLARETKAR